MRRSLYVPSSVRRGGWLTRYATDTRRRGASMSFRAATALFQVTALRSAWVYSAEGIERSADPEKLTHSEALAMARAIAELGKW